VRVRDRDYPGQWRRDKLLDRLQQRLDDFGESRRDDNRVAIGHSRFLPGRLPPLASWFFRIIWRMAILTFDSCFGGFGALNVL